ncbi:hypothetical protein KAFR_0B04290 [Kazachstania africana CBS 2517]|uniref:MICOS complex subunit n=1 Tax=Kazachstania africana (strain ATCC 22294 / BCRC 22015 / CBS 2517 / CECT 1963 / NBRC 1671 / NRRL Y-8276) TaxID=1071382 RepID=H2AQS5_KAZAF|nr:hypothetical protein KAFR_0B04290 [Kazachstania africana CBS 2517]CCF56725.1 hypothetical protein KAFR_0B04290 [Kazachstania africana CBS 2517]
MTDFYKKIDPETEKLSSNQVNESVTHQPEQLVNFIHEQRSKLVDVTNKTKDNLNQVNDEYHEKGRQLTSKIAALSTTTHDNLLAGLSYTAVAVMTGSILARRKAVSFKILTPVLFGSICAVYTLPSTLSNMARTIYEAEKRNFPTLIKKQDEIMIELREGKEDTLDFFHKCGNIVRDWFK